MDIRISVRSLVEFIFRSGDISDSSSGTLPLEAMNAGSRIHRKLQKRAGSYYRSEVPLKIEVASGAHHITLEGRADGIVDRRGEEQNTDNVLVDEIKGVYRRLEELTEPVRVHMTQAMCYAYIYAHDNGLDRIDVRISYVNLESEKEKYFVETFDCERLAEWFDGLMSSLAMWLDLAEQHKTLRDRSIETLEFPFGYREGQKLMALYTYRAIEHGKHLYVQAPTGIGKTMAAVYPAVKSFVLQDVSKLFFLTAKTIANTAPLGALRLLTEKGLVLKTVVLTAKEKVCPQEEMDCNPFLCPYAAGHYDRVNEALYELVSHEAVMDRETILRYADEYKVCPFELCLDASLFADAVTGDYNYVFDPRVSLKRFFAGEGGTQGRYVFLVDEAHNLVDRASAMYSAQLIKEDFMELKKVAAKYGSRLPKYLGSCNRELLAMKKELGDADYKVLSSLGSLHTRLLSLHSAMELFLEENKSIPDRKQILEFYFKLTTFLNIAELVDENYVIYDELQPDGSFMVRLYCVKPAANIRQCLDRGVATVFFSATILPVRYYMEMLSDCEEDRAIYIPSPFDAANRRIFVANDVTTKYTRRGDEQYRRIYEYIRLAVSAESGNYMAFFPSYRMLEQVMACIDDNPLPENVRVIFQQQGMREADREDFLREFDGGAPVLAFCIMGGIFSEGIDLVGDRLIGAIVVGPGLPQVCTERRLMMDYFDSTANGRSSEDGFRYAYQYPGINKVFQAAGRVIRTESDRGVILLLDERFAQGRYTELFPVEWNDYVICNIDSIGAKLDEFWNGK